MPNQIQPHEAAAREASGPTLDLQAVDELLARRARRVAAEAATAHYEGLVRRALYAREVGDAA